MALGLLALGLALGMYISCFKYCLGQSRVIGMQNPLVECDPELLITFGHIIHQLKAGD